MKKKINEYANSMFRFENIHENWIQLCVDYLKSIYKDKIRDKVILDYAFGRGNWSLAFSRLGAKKVISIDASLDNTLRFKKYCKLNHINNIEIICGNFLSKKYQLPSDIIWVYGIMHHIEKVDIFLQKLKDYTFKNNSEYLFNTYNKDSLRHFLIRNARRVLKYNSEKDFMEDALYLIPSARLRCRDDLTAPFIDWYDKKNMVKILKKAGFYPKRDIKDLYSFQFRKKNYEFSLNQLLCNTKRNKSFSTELENNNSFKNEIMLLQKLLNVLMKHLNKKKMKKNMLGFINTYYSKKNLGSDVLLIELSLYLIFWIKYYKIKTVNNDVIKVIKCVEKSQSGMKRKECSGNLILEYLKVNNVRI